MSDLSIVTIESTGQVSAILKSDKRPLQPGDLNTTTPPTFIPIPLIIDGELIKHNLYYIQKDMNWLTSQLQAYNLSVD